MGELSSLPASDANVMHLLAAGGPEFGLGQPSVVVLPDPGRAETRA